MSTTFDHVLAAAVNGVPFAGAARMRELWFSPNQSTGDQQRNASRPAADEVPMFQLFGEASSTRQYAVHEEDVLEAHPQPEPERKGDVRGRTSLTKNSAPSAQI